jgi:hypothetical protein
MTTANLGDNGVASLVCTGSSKSSSRSWRDRSGYSTSSRRSSRRVLLLLLPPSRRCRCRCTMIVCELPINLSDLPARMNEDEATEKKPPKQHVMRTER